MPDNKLDVPSPDEDFDVISDGMRFESMDEPELADDAKVLINKSVAKPIVKPSAPKPDFVSVKVASKPKLIAKPVAPMSSAQVVRTAQRPSGMPVATGVRRTAPMNNGLKPINRPVNPSTVAVQRKPAPRAVAPMRPAQRRPQQSQQPQLQKRPADSMPVLNLPPLPKLDNLEYGSRRTARQSGSINRAPIEKAEKNVAKPARVNRLKFKKAASHNVLRTVIDVVLIVIIGVVGIYAYHLHSNNKSLQSQLASANKTATQNVPVNQTQALIQKVGLLTDLPTGETPTIANVTDVNEARKQSSFFDKAENGDKVLMYTKAGQAILYRPSTNKVIEVAPMDFTTSNSSTSSSSSDTTQ